MVTEVAAVLVLVVTKVEADHSSCSDGSDGSSKGNSSRQGWGNLYIE